ncbi:MAG: terminase small subunit [Sulfuricaulis sp.]|nr:terminase small subunit [Sulfuricaulis sp.]
MGILRNAKHEMVAAGLADGLSQEAAYIKAGFSAKKARSNASTLIKQKKNILERRDEILAERESLRSQGVVAAAEKEQVTKEYVLRRLKTVAERCLQSEPVVDRKGFPVVIEKQGEGGESTPALAYVFNSMGANRALELLGKEIGMFIERKEQGKPGEFESMSEKDLEHFVQEKAVKIGWGKALPVGKQKRLQ